MTLVAGIDSSTQSCKVVVRDAGTGALVRHGRAAHPDGTEVDPGAWWTALQQATQQAGGLGDVAAVSVGGQQHGMVCLDQAGEVVRPALLWNDIRSAQAAADLVEELGGPAEWAEAVGSVPLAAFTVSKLRWLAEHEPDNAARTEAVCLPHDWLTWQLTGSADLGALVTDRGDASGTGYWSPATGQYRPDLLRAALGRDAAVPRVLGPAEQAGSTSAGCLLGPGTGDNAAAALGAEPATATSSCPSALQEWSAPSPQSQPPTPAGSWPASPTPPDTSCRWCAPSTRPACWTLRRGCSAWTTRSSPASRCRLQPVRAVWC